MASIHKRPSSKYWHAAWRGGDGRLNLRSTKQTERAKALATALDWERIDKKLGTGGIAEGQVRQVINEMLERVGEPALPLPSVQKWFTDWTEAKENSKSAGTAERYKGVVIDFLSHMGNRAEKSLASLSARDFEAYLSKRKTEGVSNSTRILDIKILRTALNRARRLGLIANNPAEAVDLPKRQSIERGVFTAPELKSLLETAKGKEWETVIMFGVYTGARLGDCTKMQRKMIDGNIGTITYRDSKNGKDICIPMHPELQKYLEQLPSGKIIQQFITPHMAGLGPGGRHGLSEGFKRIVKNAKLDLQTVQGTGMRKISKRTFHALRHSFTSALANAGVPAEVRMKLTGHKSEAVHKGYTHLELETLKQALQKLPNVAAEKSTP
jgi:integrase